MTTKQEDTKVDKRSDTNNEPEEVTIRWSKAFRIIPSRYPPIDLFERIADPAEWEILAQIESLTNDRIRDEVGQIRLVPPQDRVSGPGASWVMASFTHIGNASRFSNGDYGVYYATNKKSAAISETTYHMSRFLLATKEPPSQLEMRVLVGGIHSNFHNVRDQKKYSKEHNPLDWTAAQVLGFHLRKMGSNGVVYCSVRHPSAECVGAFRPKAVGIPTLASSLLYRFDGDKIAQYFDYSDDRWHEVNAA